MRTINIPYFSIRLMTVWAYFLPFIFFLSTCTNDLTSKEAYNKTDAIANEQEKLTNKLATYDELTQRIDTVSNNLNGGILTELRRRINERSDNSRNLDTDLPIRLLCSTDYSLSGIGSIYNHKNITGRITIGISLFISLITLILWRFFNRKKITVYFLAANMITVLFFISDCLVSDVSLLYGVWVLLFLISVQLLTEIRALKTNHAVQPSDVT